jgi:hypothetical protein
MPSFIKELTDEFLTPTIAWENVLKFIQPETVVWDSAYHTSSKLSVVHKNTVCRDIDFLTDEPVEEWGIQLTNVPFSKKAAWLERSLHLGKPFVLLMPSDVIHRRYFQKLFKDEHFQLLIPSTRIHFVDQGRPNFECVWVSHGMNFAKDIQFV